MLERQLFIWEEQRKAEIEKNGNKKQNKKQNKTKQNKKKKRNKNARAKDAIITQCYQHNIVLL